LKDAAASAIYGANASNGVVLITTKPGQGRPRVEYSGSVSSSSVTRLPTMLNAAQFRTAVQQNAPQFDTLLLNANTDWFSQVDRTAIGQEHNVALSGAGATNSYRVSLGYLHQDGILRGTTAERLTLGVTYDQRLYDNHLDLRANLKGSRSNDQFTPNGVLYNATQAPTKGSYYRTTPNQVNTVLDAYLDYTPPSNIGSGTLDLTAGYSYSQSHFDSAGTLVTQFASNALGDNGIPSTGLVQP